jgi:beta-xylosidase
MRPQKQPPPANRQPGPIEKGEILKGCDQIDPSVFIDDDGQAYLYWG